MTTEDRAGFLTLLLGLGDTYSEAVSELRLEIYFRALSDLTLDALKAAVSTHILTSKFFPRPSELREASLGPLEDEAERAWLWVLREIQRVGYMGIPAWPNEATRRAATSLYGGWRPLCERLPGEGPELLGWRKQFHVVYACYARADARAGSPDANQIAATQPVPRLSSAPAVTALSREDAESAYATHVAPVLERLRRGPTTRPKDLATPPSLNQNTLQQIEDWRRTQPPGTEEGGMARVRR